MIFSLLFITAHTLLIDHKTHTLQIRLLFSVSIYGEKQGSGVNIDAYIHSTAVTSIKYFTTLTLWYIYKLSIAFSSV
jgi:hypothetical protein